jgi:hypothetical protein
MRVAGFVGILIGIGLLVLASFMTTSHETYEQHQAIGVFVWFPGFMLIFICAAIWVSSDITRLGDLFCSV